MRTLSSASMFVCRDIKCILRLFAMKHHVKMFAFVCFFEHTSCWQDVSHTSVSQAAAIWAGFGCHLFFPEQRLSSLGCGGVWVFGCGVVCEADTFVSGEVVHRISRVMFAITTVYQVPELSCFFLLSEPRPPAQPNNALWFCDDATSTAAVSLTQPGSSFADL